MERRIVGRRRFAPAGIAVAVAAILGLEAAIASPGANFAVNSSSDAVDAIVGDGSCATAAGTCTLRAAIQEANALPGTDVIEISAGTYEIAIPPLNQNDVTTGDLDITDSLTITGAAAASTIVDAGVPAAGAPPQVHGLDRIFEVTPEVDGGSVSFSGLTLRDGYAAEYGGAIANNSTASVTVRDSVLTNNVAGKAGGAIDNHFGGDVDVVDSTVSGNFANETGSALNNNRDGALTVTNATVSANSAAAVGLDEALMGAGAIANNAELDAVGTITVTASRISDNRAGGGRSGATISNDGAGIVSVDRTTFSKNIAAGDGGAIFNDAGEVSVSESTFTENAARDGGAIYNNGRGRAVSVRGSTFSLNSASARGGAIASGGTGILTVLNSTFSKNRADGWGGAILSDDKASTAISSSTFSENSGLNGGAFANEGTGLVTVKDSTFVKNRAFAGLILSSGEGGALHTNSVGEVVITGGAFSENHARSGGGLSNEGGGTLQITGTRFSANSAEEQGGGLLIQSGAVRMLDIDVIGNRADSALEGGGGISYQGDKLLGIGESAAIAGSRIRDNRSSGAGGGIDSRGDGTLAVTTTSITGNTAAMGGAIHHVGDAPLKVTRSTLSGNFAEGGGGAFSDGDGEATIENSTISGNRAGQFGGGLLVSSRMTLRSSTVASNSAASGGGINNGGGDLVGDGSVFLANTIVANSPIGENCAGSMTSLGGNVENADSCKFRELSDQPGTDPRLGLLGDNGGPTQTHALLAGSPAQERAVCTEFEPCPLVDQRGVTRPQLGADAGAYESESPPGGGGGQPCAGMTERPLRADADSWVSQAAPGTNSGSDAILKVQSKPGANDRSLVHFTLPTVPPGCKLVGATLRLYSASATDGHTLQALRVASGWSEAGVTWANQPATAGPAATTQSGSGVREWDVLVQARDMYTSGAHGFLIRDADENGSGEQSFHSREKGVDRPPELVLVFDDPDAPPQPGDCPTTPQSLSADRDSWVNEGSPANNFGNDSTLKVKSQGGSAGGNNARALLRFRLPPLPSGCTGIARATLRMDAASGKEGRTLEALQVASAWAETGVTWSNQPHTTGPAATTPSAEGLLDWAVTTQVVGMYATANHGFLIRDADENGIGDEQTLNSRDKLNDGAPELEIVFDDAMLETTITETPPATSTSTSAAFAFTAGELGSTFECALDGAAFSACSSPREYTGLVDGSHNFRVRAVDLAGNRDATPSTYDWTVDTTVPDTLPPDTTITGRPADPSSTGSATFTFTASDDKTPLAQIEFRCRLDSQPVTDCTSPTVYTGLSAGSHTFEVRAVDLAGNADGTPATHTWTIDTTAPVTAVTGVPADPSKDTSASFAFSSEPGVTFECALDTGAFAACSSPHTTPALADGSHTFEVRATDAAGNEGVAAAYTWIVDTTAPQTTITAAPPATTSNSGTSFNFSAEPGSTFACSLDGAAFAACTSPTLYTGLSAGAHTFEVRAVDRAGNVDGSPATHTWTIDTTAPQTTIDSGPADPTKDTSVSFAFSSEPGATFECALDGGAFAACSSPVAHTELADGQHSFRIRATDRAGNDQTVTHNWTVSAGDASAGPANPDAGSGDPSGGGGGALQSIPAGAAPDTSAPDVKLRAPSSMRASALRRGGAKLAVTASEDGRIVAQLRTAGGRVLARADATARAGQRTFVRLRAGGMAGRRLTLHVTAVDLAGNRRTISRPLRVTAR